MDGEWQICAKTAYEYARVAKETAKMIKTLCPETKLVACGSSNSDQPTFGEWERTVLRECWDYIDFLSLHNYYRNDEGDYASFLSSSESMDSFIDTVADIIKEVGKEKGSDKKIQLSFDEWNVWYHASHEEYPPKWITPRAIEEEAYDKEDSLVVFSLMSSLINHSDSVAISCLAQLVNVIAPITTVPGGEAFVRTIYWPFLHVAKNTRGNALSLVLDAPHYDSAKRKDVSYLAASAVLSEDEKNLVLLLLNKNKEEEMTVSLCGLEGKVVEKISYSIFQEEEEPKIVACNEDASLLKIGKAEWQILKIALD